MIDIQRKAPGFKWVCISLFVLVTIFYFRGCGVRLNVHDFIHCLFPSEDYSISSIWYVNHTYTNIACEVRPLQNLCYILAYEAAGYQHIHIVLNIFQRAMQLAASVCIFLLMRRLTTNTLVGISSAALFAGFYAHEDTVLSGWRMDDQLLCVSGLLSIIFYIRHLDGKGTYNYILALISLCLACLSKESGACMFPVILLVDIYLRKETVKQGGPWRNGLSMRGVKMCLPFFLLSILYLLLAFSSECVMGANAAMNRAISFSWLTEGTCFTVLRGFYDVSVQPIAFPTAITKLIIILSVVVVYVISDKGFRRLVQLLVLCSLIVISPCALYLPGLEVSWAYFPGVFAITLFACVMNQGAEKLSGLSLAQSFFVETPKRRLLALIVACWLIIHHNLVKYNHDAYLQPVKAYTLSILKPLYNHSTVYGFMVLIVSLVLLGTVVVYLRSSKEVKGFIHLAVLCTPFLMIPTFSHNFQGRLSYLIAALPVATLVCAMIYVMVYAVEKCLNSRAVDLANPLTFCLALLLFIHSSIFINNYGFIQYKIKDKLKCQQLRDWVAKPIRGFLLQEDTYRDKAVHLLNFPPVVQTILSYPPPAHRRDYWKDLEGLLFEPGTNDGGFPTAKSVVAYTCGLDLDAFDDMDTLPGRFVEKNIDLGPFSRTWIPPNISEEEELFAEEFNALASDPGNRMLLLDNVTEQILDVSGMDFDRVEGLIANKEKQKAFILP